MVGTLSAFSKYKIDMNSFHNKKTGLLIVIGALAIVGIGLVLNRGGVFGKQANAEAMKKLPLVTVTVAQTRDLPIKFTAQGHLVSLNQVDVRPQINGTIRGVHFHEGDQVTAGQLLFTLDDSDLTAQYHRFQAQAAQYKAQLDDARRDLNRSQELVKENFISPSAVDTSASKAAALEAQLKAANADIESARIQLSRTRITSPISGVAGALTVHPGSLAQQNGTSPLISLSQFDPIGLEFSLPEKNLGQILTARASSPVTVTLDAPDGQRVEGKLSFINNTVSTDTGTINLKASFPNQKKNLWPGSFARVILDAGISKGAVVVPPQAVLEGPDGRFVYIVGNNSIVESKPVILLRVQDEYAVVQGIDSGTRIVLEGNQNLRAGSAVQVTTQMAKTSLPAATNEMTK